jgi:L-arabinokinase
MWTMRKVVYYVTGHGYGHATRALGMIAELLVRGACVEIVSAMQPTFFLESICKEHLSRVTTHTRMLDSGALQVDPLTMDVQGTLEAYRVNVHERRDELLDSETAFLIESRPDVVLVDATALACSAARRANIPSILITNFTWDNIYVSMVADSLPASSQGLYDDMLRLIETDVSSASLYLQLPGIMAPPQSFEGRVIKAPLICRSPKLDRETVRRGLLIPLETSVVVYGFGGQARQEGDLVLVDEMLPAGWMCVVLMGQGLELPSSRFIGLGRDVFVPDLLAASDCMLGKLGYGTASECLLTGTPLIYIERKDWPEEQPLQSLMEGHGASIKMPKADFTAGNWQPYLEEAMKLKMRGFTGVSDLRPGREALEELVSLVEKELELGPKGRR